MAALVPSLSASGWVGDVAEKADLLLSYYFVSEASQSTMYTGDIASLPQQIQQFGNDEFELRRAMQSTLERYLGRYFDVASAKVSTSKPAADDPNRTNVTVAVIVSQDGKQYSLGRLIRTLNGRIVEIANINNFEGAE